MTSSLPSNYLSFDKKEIKKDSTVYQITLKDDNTFILVPYTVIELMAKSNVSLSKIDTDAQRVITVTQPSHNVCIDPIYLIQHWVSMTENIRDQVIPLRLSSLENLKTQYLNNEIIIPPSIHTGLDESLEI